MRRCRHAPTGATRTPSRGPLASAPSVSQGRPSPGPARRRAEALSQGLGRGALSGSPDSPQRGAQRAVRRRSAGRRCSTARLWVLALKVRRPSKVRRPFHQSTLRLEPRSVRAARRHTAGAPPQFGASPPGRPRTRNLRPLEAARRARRPLRRPGRAPESALLFEAGGIWIPLRHRRGTHSAHSESQPPPSAPNQSLCEHAGAEPPPPSLPAAAVQLELPVGVDDRRACAQMDCGSPRRA